MEFAVNLIAATITAYIVKGVLKLTRKELHLVDETQVMSIPTFMNRAEEAPNDFYEEENDSSYTEFYNGKMYVIIQGRG